MVDNELAPVLIGSIDAATAERWATMSADQINLLNEARHIMPHEQQWAGGLIVGKAVVEVVDERGVPTGRAVAFDHQNLGDHSKDYDKLKKAEDNTTEDSSESERSTLEFDLQVVKDDPNLLLDTDIMTKILSADPSKFDKPEDVDALKKQVEEKVIGPEQAALVVSEIAVRAASNTLEDAEMLQAMIGNIEPGSEYANSLEIMRSSVVEMKEYLYALHSQMSSGEDLDYSIIGLADRVIEAADDYNSHHIELSQINESASGKAGGIFNRAEELKDGLRRSSNEAEYADESSRQGEIDSSRQQAVISRISERAPLTLQEHDQQTRQITSERLSAMRDVYIEAGQIEELSRDLMSGFIIRSNQFEELPSGSRLFNEAEDIRLDLSRMDEYGRLTYGYSERIQSNIISLLGAIDVFENGLMQLSGVDQETQALLQTAKNKVMRLRSFKLYEAA